MADELKGQATATQPVPADIPKGELGPAQEAANAAAATIEAAPAPAAAPRQEAFTPEEEAAGDDLVLEDDEEADAQGEDEELLLGPSDFPDQPLTFGAPIGEGPDAPITPGLTATQQRRGLAERFLATPGVEDSVRAWAVRVLMGR